MTTKALVLESNNLAGAAPEKIIAGLERLLTHLRKQTLSLGELDELIVTHEGLPSLERLERAADRAIQFVTLPPGTGYYAAKNLGFAATHSEWVAFGDADCWPDDRWLEKLFVPLSEHYGAIAGRTTYRLDTFGRALTSMDFLYLRSPLSTDCTRNFYANNVAFRREVFAAHPYPKAPGVYRGHCQMLGLELERAGIRVRFEPAAHTIHRLPDTAADLVKLRLYRGADAVDFTRVLGLGTLSTAPVLAGRYCLSLRALAEDRRGLASAVLMSGASLVDGVGMMLGAAGFLARSDADSLSYLSSAPPSR